MNILFVYSIQKSITFKKPLKGQEDIQMGLAQISSVLKINHHKTSLLVLDRKYEKRNFGRINQVINEVQPDLICFSAVNSEIDFITEIASYIKEKYAIFSVLGGVHVTISPSLEYFDVVDALCIGEGEFPLLELANKLENKEDITEIDNLWIKQNGEIFKNKPRPFIENLDCLPFVDREMWQPWILDKSSRLTVLLGRGCPYNCSYCCNHKLRQVTSGKYVRFRSARLIADEIRMLSEQHPLVTEFFLEIETLSSNIKWLLELCDELHLLNKDKKQKLFFSANLRVHDNLDVDLVFQNMKKANFNSVIIGLESGSERIRSSILNRHYSNETIIKAVDVARSYGLKVGIFNLIGLPTETISDFRETLTLNQQLQPDWHATSIFFPYEGTQLYEVTKEKGLLPPKIETKNERQHAVIDLPYFPKKEIQKQFDAFHYEVYKKNKNRNSLKLALFFIQKKVGHNFMANSKNNLLSLLYFLRIKTKLLNIIQKV